MHITKPADLDVRRLSGALGAEVRGIDLRIRLNPHQLAMLRRALLEHLVLFFPGQCLTRKQHRDFGALWGELHLTEHKMAMDDAPEVDELRASAGLTSDRWHTDVTFEDIPPQIAILNAILMPPVGGDTLWSNQYLAYDALSAPMRELLDGLTAIHDNRIHTGSATQRAEHPVVRVHPETGHRCLYVNEHYTQRIVQMSAAESKAVLEFLFAHVVAHRFTVRYRWSEGTVAMWDERCTQHAVLNDFEGERVIQRVTVQGDEVGRGTSRWEEFRPRRMTVAGSFDLVDECEVTWFARNAGENR